MTVEPPDRLSERRLRSAAEALAARDVALGRLHRRYGPPPLWARPTGFSTMVLIILEQQVSLASARAAHRRLHGLLGEIDPQGLLALDDARLRDCGFSRQKTAYCRGLARALMEGRLSLDDLAELPDEAARARLMALKGVGRWTADIYLLMGLLRPDVWPLGDLALRRMLAGLSNLDELPDRAAELDLSASWQPWRSVAARMLWNAYLGGAMGRGGAKQSAQ
jgi:DNA-3-methyladenine glycosylase II